jgi:large subunit ribosomal protein L15
MSLNSLIKTKVRRKKRVGRGESSGKGKTAGRGAKGQLKRGKVPLGFEGGQLPLYQRLPQLRGVGNSSRLNKITLATDALNQLPAKQIVSEETLKNLGMIPKSLKNLRIKIVEGGKLEKPLEIRVATSKKAKLLIEKAGGKVDAGTA